MDHQELDRLQKLLDEARSKDGIERRIYAADTMRMERRDEKEPPVMVGHAAVFDQDTEIIAGYFYERVAPGAFARAIKEDDVRSLFNHDPNFILGRNRAKPTPTLRLREDDTGLYTETDLPDTSYARDLEVSLERGDVSQMSFAFRVKAEKWEEKDRDYWLRTILEVELFDISPVTFPAYPTTDVGLRSLEAHRKAQPKGLTTVSAAALIRRGMKKRMQAAV